MHPKYIAAIMLIFEAGGGCRLGFAAVVLAPGQKLAPQTPYTRSSSTSSEAVLASMRMSVTFNIEDVSFRRAVVVSEAPEESTEMYENRLEAEFLLIFKL